MRALALALLLMIAPAALAGEGEDAKRAARSAAKACSAWLASRHPGRLYKKSTSQPSFDALREPEAVEAIRSVAPDRFRRAFTPERLAELFRADGATSPRWAHRPLAVESFRISGATAHADAVTVLAEVDYFGAAEPELIRTVWVLEGRRWVLALREAPARVADPWAGLPIGPASGRRLVQLPDEVGRKTANELAVEVEAAIAEGATSAAVEHLAVGTRVQDVAQVVDVKRDEEGKTWVDARSGWVRLRFWWPEERALELKAGASVVLSGTVSRINGEQPWMSYEERVGDRKVIVAVMDLPVDDVDLRALD